MPVVTMMLTVHEVYGSENYNDGLLLSALTFYDDHGEILVTYSGAYYPIMLDEIAAMPYLFDNNNDLKICCLFINFYISK